MTDTATTHHLAAPADRADVTALPLTAAQDGMWFAQSLDPDSPALTTGEYVCIHTDLDAPTFVTALLVVAGESDTLRMNLVETDGHRQQIPGSLEPLPVEVLDLRHTADPPAAARTYVEEDAATPFTLGGGLLFRHALLRVADDEWWWWQCIHHAIIDGYGVSQLIRRTAEVYTDLMAGRDPSPTPFGELRDVVHEALSYAHSPQHAKDRETWQALLPSAQGNTLADHRALPARAALDHLAQVSPGIAAGLRRRSREWRCSWPELAIVAHAVYFSRVTREESVVVGLPLMNRMGSVAARTPAMAMNVVPLPITVSRGATVAELAQQVAAGVRTARKHGRYRLADIRRDQHALGAERDVIGPLVNVLPFGEVPTFDGAGASAHKVSTGAVEDLTCNIIDRGGDGISVHLEANPSCYTAHEIEQHATRLVGLLEQLAVATADTPVRELDVATQLERQVLDDFNDTAHQVPFRPLTGAFDDRVAAQPDAPAISDGSGAWTYGELDARVEGLARGLAAQGAGPGTTVAIALPRSRDLTATLLAVSRSGAAYLPLDMDNPSARLRGVIDDARPVCVVTDAEHRDALGASTIDIAGLVDDSLPPSPWPVSAPEDPAYVIYTSGTTGRPKGVVVPHAAIDNRLRWMQHAHPIGPGDRVLQKTPVGFDVSVWEFFWPFREGAELVMADPGGHRDPAYLRKTLQDRQITVCHFVPSMLRVFLDTIADGLRTDLRVVFSSGEALSRGLAEDFARLVPSARLVNLYGPTEAAVDVTCHEPSPGDDGPVPIGRPIWNTRCYVLDAGGRLCPPGVPGELHLGGAQVALGYLGREELTAAAFVPDPFGPEGARMYRTGDLACWDDSGQLQYLGRLDHQVKLNGQRLEPAEVETAIRAETGATEVAVILREDRPGDQRLVGYVAADHDTANFDAAGLRVRLASRLPHFMVPSVIVPLPALPLSANGKLDRKALPAPTIETGNDAPRSAAEGAAVAAFEAALGISGIGTEANFFDLGGTSLRVAVLTQQLRARLGVEVGMGALFRSPTPRALAALLEHGPSGDDAAVDPVLPLRSGGPRAPLFVIHPAGGLAWCYTGLLPVLDPEQPVMGLQADGLRDVAALPETMTELAGRYAERALAQQPDGAFRLLGWSVGGDIAHEMAVQLQEAGREVELLCLLDAYPADQWRDQRTPSKADTLRALLRMAGLDGGSDLDEESVLQLLRQENSRLATLPAQVLRRVPDVVRRNAALMRTHEHRRFRGELLVVVAAAARDEDWLTPASWHPYVDGDVIVHEIDCTHAELVAPAHLATIAGLIGPALST